MSPLVLIGLALNLSMTLMCAAWLICRRLNNASLVDAAWSYGFALNALLFAGIASGAPWRRLLIAVMVSAWSFRLGTRLIMRICRCGVATPDLAGKTFPARVDAYHGGILYFACHVRGPRGDSRGRGGRPF